MDEYAAPEASGKWKRYGSMLAHAASIAGIVALPIGIWSLWEAHKIAVASGSLKSSQIIFGFGGYASSKREIDVVAIISHRCNGSPILMELPIMLSNQGNKLATDVSVVLEYPLEGNSSPAFPSEASQFYLMNGPPVTEIRRSVSDGENRRYVNFTITKLQARSIINMAEVMQAPMPILIKASEIDRRLAGEIKVNYSLNIPVVISNGDDVSVSKISLSVVRANSLREAQPQIDKIMRRRVSDDLRYESTFSAFLRWVVPQFSHEIFVLYPEDYSCGGGGAPFTRTHKVKSTIYGA